MAGAGDGRIDSLRLVALASATAVSVALGLVALGSGAMIETVFLRSVLSWFVLAPIAVIGAAILRWSLGMPSSIGSSLDGSISRRRDG
ncbi:MAG: hypothetical protein EPO26_02860 [Chloroflexota bacterium]|nr:MAG: hypothetical protein EPO26_02860 [Chloroflexota bacterium]